MTDRSAATRPSEGTAPLPVLAVDLLTEPSLLLGLHTLARDLEGAGVGAITVTDGGLHPVHVAASLAPVTSALALIPRTDAIYVEPFHLATQLMSLDHVSHGRAGWLVEARTDAGAAHAVGREVLDAEQTAREAADVVDAARRIWDSWADDAVVRDLARGVYVDASRLQYADVEAETFSVRGPSITPRSPQGLVPVLVAETDRPTVGERADQLADGRALDVRVDADAPAEVIVRSVRDALAASEGTSLVRLLGLDPGGADLAARVGQAAAALRSAGAIAPAPAAGDTLRDQLALDRPDVVIDPARRSDRARLAETAA